jgi:hypothetical protein
MPAFVSPTLWPTNSPDLNPVVCKIWGVLQQRVHRIHDMNHLKRRLVEEWAQFDQAIINDAIKQWRLLDCVHAEGRHCEHMM